MFDVAKLCTALFVCAVCALLLALNEQIFDFPSEYRWILRVESAIGCLAGLCLVCCSTVANPTASRSSKFSSSAADHALTSVVPKQKRATVVSVHSSLQEIPGLIPSDDEACEKGVDDADEDALREDTVTTTVTNDDYRVPEPSAAFIKPDFVFGVKEHDVNTDDEHSEAEKHGSTHLGRRSSESSRDRHKESKNEPKVSITEPSSSLDDESAITPSSAALQVEMDMRTDVVKMNGNPLAPRRRNMRRATVVLELESSVGHGQPQLPLTPSSSSSTQELAKGVEVSAFRARRLGSMAAVLKTAATENALANLMGHDSEDLASPSVDSDAFSDNVSGMTASPMFGTQDFDDLLCAGYEEHEPARMPSLNPVTLRFSSAEDEAKFQRQYCHSFATGTNLSLLGLLVVFFLVFLSTRLPSSSRLLAVLTVPTLLLSVVPQFAAISIPTAHILHFVFFALLCLSFIHHSTTLSDHPRAAIGAPVVLLCSLAGFCAVFMTRPLFWYGVLDIAVIYLSSVGIIFVTHEGRGWHPETACATMLQCTLSAVMSGVLLYCFESSKRSSYLTFDLLKKTVAKCKSEQQRTHRLVKNCLPSRVVDTLMAGGSTWLNVCAALSRGVVIQLDVANFTVLCSGMTAREVIHVLNRLYTNCDHCAEKWGVEKVKTLGDAWIAAIHPADAGRAYHAVAHASLSIVNFVRRSNAQLSVRIGIGHGLLLACIAGKIRTQYEILGDALDEATIMESTGAPSMIQVSTGVAMMLKDAFVIEHLEPRGKGSGLYLVNASKKPIRPSVVGCLSNGPELPQRTPAHLSCSYHSSFSDIAAVPLPASIQKRKSALSRRTATLPAHDDLSFMARLQRYLLGQAQPRVSPNFEPDPLNYKLGGAASLAARSAFPSDHHQSRSGSSHGYPSSVTSLRLRPLQFACELDEKHYNRSAEQSSLKQFSFLLVALTCTELGVHLLQASDLREPVSYSAVAAFGLTLAGVVPIMLSRRYTFQCRVVPSVITLFVLQAAMVLSHVAFPRDAAFSDQIAGTSLLLAGMLMALHPSVSYRLKVAGTLIGALLHTGVGTTEHGRINREAVVYACVFVLCAWAACMIEQSRRNNWREQQMVLRQQAAVDYSVRTAESMLLNVIPEDVLVMISSGEEDGAVQDVSSATVGFLLFEDIVHMTAARYAPSDLVAELNSFLGVIDDVLIQHPGVVKLKNIPYIVVSGCPKARDDHADAVSCFVVAAVQAAQLYNEERQVSVKARAGIHSGKLCAGLLGTSNFVYDIFGDCVNLASRLASTALPFMVQLSEETHGLIPHLPVSCRGRVMLKGKGKVKCYYYDPEGSSSLPSADQPLLLS
eukprot:gene4719-7249_t